MRFLCVQIDLLLDGWTDSHETFGVYIVRPGLLHGVLFDFRSELPNRKLAVFRTPEVENTEPEVENVLDEKRIQSCSVSPILLFWNFEQGRHQRLLKIFASYVTVYEHTRTKMILAATRFQKWKNEDRTLIIEIDELSDEIFFDFRFPRNSLLPVWGRKRKSKSWRCTSSGWTLPPLNWNEPLANNLTVYTRKFHPNRSTEEIACHT